MATQKSDNITVVEGSSDLGLHRKKGRIKTVIDEVEVLTTSLQDGDFILACPIPTNAVIMDVMVVNDDLDSNGTPTLAADVGLAYSGIGGTQKKNGNTSGTAVDNNGIATLVTTLQSANTTWTSLRFEASDIDTIDKEAWEVGGLSADPGGLFYIVFEITTSAATAAAGGLKVRVDYI